MSASDVLAGVRAQLAQVSAVPPGDERAPVVPGLVVVVAGVGVGVAAWLAARGFLAIGVAPAVAGGAIASAGSFAICTFIGNDLADAAGRFKQ